MGDIDQEQVERERLSDTVVRDIDQEKVERERLSDTVVEDIEEEVVPSFHEKTSLDQIDLVRIWSTLQSLPAEGLLGCGTLRSSDSCSRLLVFWEIIYIFLFS